MNSRRYIPSNSICRFAHAEVCLRNRGWRRYAWFNSMASRHLGFRNPPKSGLSSQTHPAGMPVDVLSGFVDENGNALGRPVGVAIDRAGALLVADDVGNTVWRVTPARAKTAGN